MKLLVEEPNQPGRFLPWNVYTQGEFELDKDEVEFLESGATLWRGRIALSLEEEHGD